MSDLQTLYIENLTRTPSDEMCTICWFSMETITYSILRASGVTGLTDDERGEDVE